MAQIIDNHVHLLSGRPGKEYEPPNYRWSQAFRWAYGAPNKPPYERDPMDIYVRQEERVADPDGTATIAAMDRAGVDAAVLIHADFGPSHGGGEGMTLEEMHQSYTDLQNKYPGRLYAFAGPDVRRPGSLDLVEKAFRDWDTKGLKVFPELGYFVNDPILYPFYLKCLEYKKPIAICTNFESPFARARFNDPLYVTDVVADFPDLDVIIFHAGYPFEHWFEITVATARFALNTYLGFDAWLHPGRRSEEEMVKRLATDSSICLRACLSFPRIETHNSLSSVGMYLSNTFSAFPSWLVTKTLFPSARECANKFPIVWDLPVPGGP